MEATVRVRVEGGERDQLEDLARSRETTISVLVREAIRRFLEAEAMKEGPHEYLRSSRLDQGALGADSEEESDVTESLDERILAALKPGMIQTEEEIAALVEDDPGAVSARLASLVLSGALMVTEGVLEKVSGPVALYSRP